MRKIWRLTAFVGAAMLALIVAVSLGVAANPHASYTCTKEKKSGGLDVRVDVPETAVGGLTNAGFTCVANQPEETTAPADEGDDPGDEQGDSGDEESETDEQGSEEDALSLSVPGVDSPTPVESRSLFCATAPTSRGNGDGVGIALNLFNSQGQHLVEMGFATPAIFYEGLGASCDVLPGYEYAGLWVDSVGDIVPGVAVYPLFVAT